MQATHTHTHTDAQKRNTKQRNSGKLTKQQQVACWSVSLSLLLLHILRNTRWPKNSNLLPNGTYQ